MGIEQIPNSPAEPSKEQPPYPGWILKNGIWRDPTKEENSELKKDKMNEDIEDKETDKKLRSLEEELKELDNKEYINPNDKKRKEKLEVEYAKLDRQTRKAPEKEKNGEEKKADEKRAKAENIELEKTTINKEDADKFLKGTKEPGKEGKKEKSDEEKRKENLEREVTKKYNDELEKIKQMPDNTGKLKKEKTEKYFELINSWKDIAYLDNYKGIQNIFSELNKLKPSIFLYDLKKSQTITNIGLSMALNYKEWDLKDKEKLKIIKNFINKESKENNIFYSKDKTFKEIAKILASEDIPFKGNIDVIVKNIENPDIKSETIAEILKIENESIKEKKELLKQTKENIAEEKMPSEEKIKEQAKKIGVSEEIISKLLTEGSEILKDQDVQKKVQELKDVIEKKAKEKGKIPDCVAKTKKFIEEKDKDKKESPWKTAFGVAGFGILLFLVLFMLAELKGIDYLSGQAVGGKKKEKK